ncbi:MAG: hypothetical protein VKL59_21520 [Nostocaceae cyanobacterium]|nr:hypothetical protein [Nostocaceae cyanobacterium]
MVKSEKISTYATARQYVPATQPKREPIRDVLKQVLPPRGTARLWQPRWVKMYVVKKCIQL